MAAIKIALARILRGITRERVKTALGVLLIAVIAVCVVIIVIALLRNYDPDKRPLLPNYPTTRFSVTPTRPYYKNCREAHADGRWDIPEGDPAYRPGLDSDHNGIACESRKSRRGAR